MKRGGGLELSSRPLDNASKFSLPRDGRRSGMPVCKRVKVRETAIRRREVARRQSPLCLVICYVSVFILAKSPNKCVTLSTAKATRDCDLYSSRLATWAFGAARRFVFRDVA